jgi:hypothetical protein
MTQPKDRINVDFAALRGYAGRADGLGTEIGAIGAILRGASSLPENAFSAVATETDLPSAFTRAVEAQLAAVDAAARGLGSLGSAVAGTVTAYEEGEAEQARSLNAAAVPR